ncbi:hypothetical protein GGU11DRAFT_466616 [Lentinula aff. detonsa]|nr:hypothetical protein GGU11DRAFT_466616 [Lentinula aff. detonsa]
MIVSTALKSYLSRPHTRRGSVLVPSFLHSHPLPFTLPLPSVPHLLRFMNPHCLKPGTYRLINLQSHTALDLSEGDGRTLIGWTQHNKPNQQFIFTPLGHGGGYLIQNAWNSNYVTVEDGICTGISVVGSGFPATWVVEEIDHGKHDITGLTGNCFRIRWPNSRYVVDMEGYGCDKDGTRVSLQHLYLFPVVKPCTCRSSLPTSNTLSIHARSGDSRKWSRLSHF